MAMPPATGQRKRALIGSGERHIVRLVQVNLERQGYEVLTAYDGIECLEKAKSEKPDLIVLDVMMPRMDGFEALQRLKTDPETSHIPVIMLTARAQDRDVLQGYQYGADLYLTKPFSPLELISLVKRDFGSREVLSFLLFAILVAAIIALIALTMRFLSAISVKGAFVLG